MRSTVLVVGPLLLAAACGGGEGGRQLPPPSAEPPAAEAEATGPVEATGQALVAPGVDPPMLPPRPADQEEELAPLIAWARLDAPPDFEEVVPWQEAHRHLGRRMAVEGRIVRSYNSGRACFLNFDQDWQGKFHGVIFASSFGEYPAPPEELFLDRRVRLIGKISEHQGAPQIVIEEPRQILVLDE